MRYLAYLFACIIIAINPKACNNKDYQYYLLSGKVEAQKDNGLLTVSHTENPSVTRLITITCVDIQGDLHLRLSIQKVPYPQQK